MNELDYSILRTRGNVHSRLYDSRAGLAAYYPYEPRDIDFFQREHARSKAKIHHSLLERISWRSDAYAPANLPDEFDIVAVPSNDELPSAAAMEQALKQQNEQRQAAWRVISKRKALWWTFFIYTLIVAYGVLDFFIV